LIVSGHKSQLSHPKPWHINNKYKAQATLKETVLFNFFL